MTVDERFQSIQQAAQAHVAALEARTRIRVGVALCGHAAGAFPFGVKVVGAPDYEVTVEAFDAQKHTPIKGVHVLLHPYRALTDENGVAKVKVTKGTYKLHVSGFTYVAYQNTIDVAGDVTTRAELTAAVDDEEDHYG